MSTSARVRETCRGNNFRVVASDACQAAAMLLLLISVAVGTSSPKPSYSWARGWLNVPYTDGSYHKMTVNFGLTHFVQCVNDVPPGSDFYGCNTFDLGDIQNSNCKTGGQGVIAAAVFAMLFGLVSIFFLHAEVNDKSAFGRRIPFPRLLLNLFAFLSLVLYIVVVSLWFQRCYNDVADIVWFADTGAHQFLKDSYAGYAVATAIIAIFFSFCSYMFAFWRSCSPNKSEATAAAKQPTVQVSTATTAAALANAAPAWSSSSALSANNVAAAAAGAQVVATYGNAYSNAYSNEPPPPAYSNDAPEGVTRGGYGGAYSNGGYGGSGGAYGDAGGADGGSAYGNGKSQSAYGY